MKVLFVCLGNICRSPLAEGIFIKKLEERGLQEMITVDSCGTGAYHVGERPDPRTLQNAKNNNVELPSIARQFHPDDFTAFDIILAMDRSNLQYLQSLASEEHMDKLRLMRDFDPEAKGAGVPDPYFGGDKGFEEVYVILNRSAENLLDWLISEYPELQQA